jgi:hypothetical protein
MYTDFAIVQLKEVSMYFFLNITIPGLQIDESCVNSKFKTVYRSKE